MMTLVSHGHSQALSTIEFVDVRKSFASLEVLTGVSASIPAGSTLCVLGSSGSGKSTLVRCINHLEGIQGGTIRVNDVEIRPGGLYRNGHALSRAEVARYRTDVGMVFQSFNLFQHQTALKNLIEAPIGVLKWGRERAVKRARELLSRVGLPDKEDAYPFELSGGQQQRIAIARSLMLDPSVLLFDEPTSALDPELTGEVLAVIRDLALVGRTSVIVTHEMSFAREVATHVMVLDRGVVTDFGLTQDVFENPKSERTRNFLRMGSG